jgi:RNA polymerase sigma-70 factor (ECF subfamily)
MDNTSEILPNAVNPQIWFEEYHDSLFKYALTRLRDADLAEEKIQETFLAALKSRKNFQGLASEKTWLISILKRKICDHFRRISRDKQFNVTSPVECLRYDALDSKRMLAERSHTWAYDPSMVYEQKEFLKIIKHALSELPNRLAQVFILREVIELNSEEICEFMGINVGNLYVMMHRARKRLRQNIQLKWVFETEKSNDLKAEKWVLEQL